jgi:hypothetical protein
MDKPERPLKRQQLTHSGQNPNSSNREAAYDASVATFVPLSDPTNLIGYVLSGLFIRNLA